MKKPEIPRNETERLAELNSYNIIGEMESSDYDFLTKMASEICDTKISLISLITDKKQWFLSHNGLEARETPKDLAFCAHAINFPNEVFIVEDSRKDNRFNDNPLVKDEPHVIFYAGVPLVNESGFALGTLCVIDDSPKKLTEHQIDSLKMLSSQVMKLLELRRKSKSLNTMNIKLSKITSLFNESQRINKIGAWEFDLSTKIISWTDEVYSIHDVDLDFDNNLTDALEFYHVDDRPLVTQAMEQTIATGNPFDVTCRFYSAKGNFKWVRASGILWVEEGLNNKLIGSFQDITAITKEREKLEETLSKNQALFNASTQVCIFSTDLTGIVTTFNKGAELQLGYSASEIVGKHTPLLFYSKKEIESEAKELSEKFDYKIDGFEALVSTVKSGAHNTKEWTYCRKDGTCFPVLLTMTAIMQNDEIVGFLGMGIDISEIKKVQNDKLELLETTRNQNDRLKNFAYMVSHNLRSHTSGISMILDFLEEENPEFFSNEMFQHMRNASDNLIQTIGHLTEVVQINLGTENHTSILLRPVIEKNISSLMSQAIKLGVTIYNEVPNHLSSIGIPAYLDSIVLNFISNGIKYSAKERTSFVKVSAEISQDFVVLIFEDNGLGIDMARHGKKLFGIYKTFHKNDDSRGVGLFMSKNQIESMGGHIEVESEENIGTTFKIFLKNEKN